MSRFECHITLLKPENTEKARKLFTISESNNMKTSWITGDPVLGAGKWFYVSGYSESYDELLQRMTKTAMHLREEGFEVVREKIEQIMYDTKTGYFECGINYFACLDT